MALKLLTPLEAQSKSKKTAEGARQELASLEALITTKRNQLSEAEKAFDDALQKQRNQWSAEVQEQENRVLKLLKEVEALEERKKQALIPLTKRREELDTKASALVEREKALDDREADLDLEKATLNTRLDEVAERELQADKVAKTLSRREEGIQAQASQVALSSSQLTTTMAKVAEETKATERALSMRELALNSRDVVLTERERRVAETERGFDNREKALQDERRALTEAVNEAKKQYGIK